MKEQFALYMTYYSAKSYREMTIQIQAYLTSTEQPESPDQGALDSNSELLQPSTKQFGDVSPSLSVTSSIRESAINHATPTTFQSLTAPPSVLKEQLSLEKDTFKSKESSIAATPSPSSLLIPDKENNGDKSKFLLEVERQDDLALQILWAGHLHGVQNKVHEDETWNLFSRIQCTYAGQLMRYLELLKVRFGSALKAGDIPKNNNQTTHWSKSKDPSLWEHCFRMNCNNMLSVWNGDENLTAKQKSIPIYIRGIQYMVEQSSAKAAKASEELRIQFMLQRPQDSRKSFDRLFAVLFQFERNRELVSEWNLFSVFLEEACGQVSYCDLLLLSTF